MYTSYRVQVILVSRRIFRPRVSLGRLCPIRKFCPSVFNYRIQRAALASEDSTAAQQGSALSAHPSSGDGNNGTRPASNEGERVETDEQLDDILGGKAADVPLATLRRASITAEVQADLPENRPRHFSIRRSFSSSVFRRSSSESIYSFSRKATETIATSKTIKRFAAVVGFFAVLFTFIGFYPAYGQYYYSKITWDASVQSANQSASLQDFQLKTQFYQSCQMNKVRITL
jgi:hypothetical protein